MTFVFLMVATAFLGLANNGVVDEGTANTSALQPPVEAYTAHAPIRINNNSDLAGAAASGSGILLDPYIIEGYDINANGSGCAIYIGNTTDYFVIRNCTLYNASYQASPYNAGGGMILYNNSAPALVTNNIISGNKYGIYIDDVNSPVLSENRLEANAVGIFSGATNTVRLSNTTISGSTWSHTEYGIPINEYSYGSGDYIDYLANATYTKVFNITDETYLDVHIWGWADAPDLDLGIFLDGKDGSPLEGQAQKAEFIQYCADSDADEEVALNPPQVGTYLIKVAGYDVTGNPGHFDMRIATRTGNAGVFVKGGTMLMTNTSINNIFEGVVIGNANISGTNTNIVGSTYGVYVYDSGGSNISSLTIRDGVYGMYIYNSTDLSVYKNILVDNSNYAIYFDASNGSTVWLNQFFLNKATNRYYKGYAQAYDNGKNYWNHSGIGNYWLDWAENNDTNDMDMNGIVDWPYPLDGGTLDYYPLKNETYDKKGPFFDIIAPSHSSNISDPLPLIQVKITDNLTGVDKSSIRLWIDNSAWNDTLIPDNPDRFYTMTSMPMQKMNGGNHILKVSASDNAGNPSNFTWNFTIWDNTPPVIKHNRYEMNSVGNATEIIAAITDDFSVKSATLYYANVGSPTIYSVVMTPINGIYVGYIPAQTSTGNVSYHIEATDGINNATTGTYLTKILSNRGVVIRHNPIAEAEINMVIPIKAEIPNASHATLWYDVGSAVYTSSEMDNGGIGDVFYGYIPAQKQGATVYYYIEAFNSTDSLTTPIDSSLYQINITGVGELGVAMMDDIKTLNPCSASDVWTWDVLNRLYDPLTKERNGQFEPWLAENWTYSTDNPTWANLTLRKGVKWHDGVELTGDDLVFTYKFFAGAPGYGAQVPRYLSSVMPLIWDNDSDGTPDWVGVWVDPNDPYTVHYHLKTQSATFVTDTLAMFVLPEHIWKDHTGGDKFLWPTDPADYKNATVGTGPFKFESWNKTTHISKIKTFRNYFATPPEISGMTFSVIDAADVSSAAIMDITREKIDYAAWSLGIPSAEYAKNFTNTEIEKSGEYGFYYVGFNMRDPDLGYAGYNESDVNVSPPTYNGNYTDVGKPFRRAIAHLINKTYIVEHLLNNYGNAEDSVVTEANEFWHDSNVSSYDYDPAKAVELLNSAGYNDTDSNGIRELPNRGEAPVYIITPPRYYDPVRAKIGEMIAKNATAIGLNVVSVPTDMGTIINKVYSTHDFDIYILGWSIGGSEPSYLQDFFASAFDVPGGNNGVGYHNQTFDSLCDQMMGELDVDNRRNMSFQLQEAVGYDLPYITMYSNYNIEAHTMNFVEWKSEYGSVLNYESSVLITPPTTIKIVSVPHSAPAGQGLEVSAVVTSHVSLSNVWLDYTDVDGLHHNVSMSNMGGALFSYFIPAQNHAGNITYSVYSTNIYNASFRAENRSIRITEDTTPPEIVNGTPEQNATGVQLNQVITITFSEPINTTTFSYSCSPDPGGWAVSWNSNNTAVTLGHNDFQYNTTYNFTVIGAKDSAGNSLKDAPVSVNFTTLEQENIPPSITITSPADASILGTDSVTVQWTGSDASGINHYEVRIDSVLWVDVGMNTTQDFTGLSDGSHTVDVKAIDNATNEATDSVSFTVDTTAPTVTITSPTNGAITNFGSMTVSWTGSDATSGINHYEVSIDSGSWLNVGTSTTHDFTDLSDASHTVDVKTVDNAGNEATESVTFTVDTTAPIVSISSPSNNQILTSSDVTVLWTGSDTTTGIDHYEVRIDSGSWVDVGMNTTQDFAGLPDGSHTVDVKAIDNAANEATASVTFSVDTVAPTITAHSPTGLNVSLNSTISVTFSEPMDMPSVHVNISGVRGTISWNGNTAVFTPEANLTAGTLYLVNVTGMDTAGNAMEQYSWNFTTQNMTEEPPITPPVAEHTGNLAGTVTDESGNPIAGATVTIQGTNISTTTDSAGHFLLENVSTGPHNLTISREGFTESTTPVDVKEGETTTVNPLLHPISSQPPASEFPWWIIVLAILAVLIAAALLMRKKGGNGTAPVAGEEVSRTPEDEQGPVEAEAMEETAPLEEMTSPPEETPAPGPKFSNEEMTTRLEKAYKEGRMSEDMYRKNLEKFEARNN